MTTMAFTANPLSLCIPEPSFEAWLKENGLLEVLESTPCSGNLGNQHAVLNSVGYRDSVAGFKKLNPFERLTVEDVCKRPVSWTEEFLDCGLGPTESYSWPVNLTQAKFRMQENLKRYTGNYMILAIIIFLCFLYKMPLAFLGIIFIFGLWDTIRIFGNKWSLEKQNLSYRILAFIGNLGTGLILVYCKVAVALLWAGVVSLVSKSHFWYALSSKWVPSNNCCNYLQLFLYIVSSERLHCHLRSVFRNGGENDSTVPVQYQFYMKVG